ncbi:MAG: hypothetical protein KDK66_02165 [Deltaproteobacteria bacterium]|nr:hypothetical protein [Deltaproteobacteria bacterium]
MPSIDPSAGPQATPSSQLPPMDDGQSGVPPSGEEGYLPPQEGGDEGLNLKDAAKFVAEFFAGSKEEAQQALKALAGEVQETQTALQMQLDNNNKVTDSVERGAESQIKDSRKQAEKSETNQNRGERLAENKKAQVEQSQQQARSEAQSTEKRFAELEKGQAKLLASQNNNKTEVKAPKAEQAYAWAYNQAGKSSLSQKQAQGIDAFAQAQNQLTPQQQKQLAGQLKNFARLLQMEGLLKGLLAKAKGSDHAALTQQLARVQGQIKKGRSELEGKVPSEFLANLKPDKKADKKEDQKKAGDLLAQDGEGQEAATDKKIVRQQKSSNSGDQGGQKQGGDQATASSQAPVVAQAAFSLAESVQKREVAMTKESPEATAERLAGKALKSMVGGFREAIRHADEQDNDSFIRRAHARREGRDEDSHALDDAPLVLAGGEESHEVAWIQDGLPGMGPAIRVRGQTLRGYEIYGERGKMVSSEEAKKVGEGLGFRAWMVGKNLASWGNGEASAGALI